VAQVVEDIPNRHEALSSNSNTTIKKKLIVNALYSYPYLNQQNPLFLPIIAYTLSTTKLEIRAK
jgi:hypothetical protein